MNPNLCSTCDHKKHPDDGWCYMFRHEPQQDCRTHTMRQMGNPFSKDGLTALRKLSEALQSGNIEVPGRGS